PMAIPSSSAFDMPSVWEGTARMSSIETRRATSSRAPVNTTRPDSPREAARPSREGRRGPSPITKRRGPPRATRAPAPRRAAAPLPCRGRPPPPPPPPPPGRPPPPPHRVAREARGVPFGEVQPVGDRDHLAVVQAALAPGGVGHRRAGRGHAVDGGVDQPLL